VLWRPGRVETPPRLVIGRYADGQPPHLDDEREFELAADIDFGDLWILDLTDSGLEDGTYHYWFEVDSTNPYTNAGRVYATDPTAATADWRLLAPDGLSPPLTSVPAAVIAVQHGELVACDPSGRCPDLSNDGELSALSPNNRTVIYELPPQWTRVADEQGVEVAAGTFEDVLSLVEPAVAAPSFPQIAALDAGRAHLLELGATTLELLPIADSVIVLGWKYGTTNYFGPDHVLGQPDGKDAPEPNSDLATLVTTCHRAGLRFFFDAVMGFSRQDPYAQVNFSDFHVRWLPSGDPNQDPEQDGRNAWGGDLWKYNYSSPGYDPIGGSGQSIYPARRFMQAFIARWVLDQRIDGIRIDSVDTVYNWDFVAELREYARSLFAGRAAEHGLVGADAEARFLVVGEYLSMPTGLLRSRVDAMWNDEFKYALRAALVGRVRDGDPDFATTIRKIVDCRGRIADYQDTAEAINYVTSHDVGNYNSMRLFNYLTGPPWYVFDAERRIKLAFAVLMTAVGIPMIFAGEEFADQHDLPIPTGKETDPVNFNRLDADPWRKRVFDYVCRLVRFRQETNALCVNDTEFIHIDQTPGRQVFVWRRGGPSDDPVVVIANFSDWETDNPTSPAAEYVVPNWPATPSGRQWREITQDRDVPEEWIGREPLYAWEAKVYTLAPPTPS
jgi:1,4-alpha-glucan branching enzyme